MVKSVDNNDYAYRKHFQIGGLTLRLESELAFRTDTFHPKFQYFEVNTPGQDRVTVAHYFGLPDLECLEGATPVYQKAPWVIFKRKTDWIYCQLSRTIPDAISGLSDWAAGRKGQDRPLEKILRDLGYGSHRIQSVSLFDQDDRSIRNL